MKVIYSKQAEKQIKSAQKSGRDFSDNVRKKILGSINILENATSFYDITKYPPFRLEKLKGDRKEEWSIRVGSTGYRMIIMPCDDSGQEIIDGDVIAICKSIKVVLVKGVSKHYE